ncbi:hypothetical protein TYRP_019013, partial [Tyrophagus putrescentiae]
VNVRLLGSRSLRSRDPRRRTLTLAKSRPSSTEVDSGQVTSDLAALRRALLRHKHYLAVRPCGFQPCTAKTLDIFCRQSLT